MDGWQTDQLQKLISELCVQVSYNKNDVKCTGSHSLNQVNAININGPIYIAWNLWNLI